MTLLTERIIQNEIYYKTNLHYSSDDDVDDYTDEDEHESILQKQRWRKHWDESELLCGYISINSKFNCEYDVKYRGKSTKNNLKNGFRHYKL